MSRIEAPKPFYLCVPDPHLTGADLFVKGMLTNWSFRQERDPIRSDYDRLLGCGPATTTITLEVVQSEMSSVPKSSRWSRLRRWLKECPIR